MQTSVDKEVSNLFISLKSYKKENGKYQIPEKEGSVLLKKFHEALIHPGVNKLYSTLNPVLAIGNMKKILKEINKGCIKCLESKNTASRFGEIKGKISGEERFEKISADILGPLNLENLNGEGKGYVLTITDTFSRFSRFIPLKTISTKAVTKAFEKQWLDIYPKPRIIHTDNGTQFNSKELQKLCESYSIKQTFTSPYNPTANGISERLNSTILNGLRLLKNEDFKTAIQKIQEADNLTFHSTIETSPIIAADLSNTPFKQLEIRVPNQKKILEKIKEKNQKTLRKLNKARISSFTYMKGMEVMIKSQSTNKLDNPWIGPYTIEGTRAEGNSILVNMNGIFKWHNIKAIKPVEGVGYRGTTTINDD